MEEEKLTADSSVNSSLNNIYIIDKEKFEKETKNWILTILSLKIVLCAALLILNMIFVPIVWLMIINCLAMLLLIIRSIQCINLTVNWDKKSKDYFRFLWSSLPIKILDKYEELEKKRADLKSIASKISLDIQKNHKEDKL